MGNFVAFLLTFKEEIEEEVFEEVLEEEVFEEVLEEEEFDGDGFKIKTSEEEEVFEEISEVSEEESEEEEFLDFEMIILKKSYSPREVSELIRNNDYYTLLSEFIRITGCSELSCSHCKNRQKKIHVGWVEAIKRKCLKLGISEDMKLPKTCDEQLKANDISNSINNVCYPMMRQLRELGGPTTNIQTIRSRAFEKIGRKTRPYRY